LKIYVGGIATFGSALPYNIVTGTTNSGDTGATSDRPVVSGAVISRNAGRGHAIYDFSPFIERRFSLGSDRVSLTLRTDAINVFNHPNFVVYAGPWNSFDGRDQPASGTVVAVSGDVGILTSILRRSPPLATERTSRFDSS
jgi:hypothetical protein